VVGHVDDRHLAPSKRTACAISTGAVREDRVVGGVAHAVDLEKRFARPTSATGTTSSRISRAFTGGLPVAPSPPTSALVIRASIGRGAITGQRALARPARRRATTPETPGGSDGRPTTAATTTPRRCYRRNQA
jgi:hypothetical protein